MDGCAGAPGRATHFGADVVNAIGRHECGLANKETNKLELPDGTPGKDFMRPGAESNQARSTSDCRAAALMVALKVVRTHCNSAKRLSANAPLLRFC